MILMKFVYFGYDFMLGAARRLIAGGHELIGAFTFPCDNIFNFNTELTALCRDLNIPLYHGKPEAKSLAEFVAAGCGCFIAAGYLYKIPMIEFGDCYALNIHPSLLPKGRGIMPSPHIIIGHPDAAGFTIHKLTAEYDAGDILYQEALDVHPRETVESLSVRIALRVPGALSRVMQDLPRLWRQARPQDESQASFFPALDTEMRKLDWTKTVSDIDRTARAFGRYGSLARIEGASWIVCAHDAWEEAHGFTPGTLVLNLAREKIIAAKDGFVCLKEFKKI